MSLHCAFLIRDFSAKTHRALLPSSFHLFPAPPSPLLSLVVHILIAGKNLPETIISPGKSSSVKTDDKGGQSRVHLKEPRVHLKEPSSSGNTAIEMAPKGLFLSLSFGGTGMVSARGKLWGPFE